MRVKTQARREGIISAAWEIFRRDGYGRTTMSAIAARLGGSKGTLYSYFASKDELLLATVDHVLAERGQAAFARLESPHLLSQRLEKFAHDYITLRSHPDTIALDRILIAEAGRSNIGQAMQDRLLLPQWRRFAEFLREQAENGHLTFEDAEEAASDFRALLTAPLLEHCLYSDRLPDATETATLAARSVRTFMRAYAPQSSGDNRSAPARNPRDRLNHPASQRSCRTNGRRRE